MEIKIDFSALERLGAQMRAAPEVVRQELLSAMTEADLLIEREVKERTPHAAGTLRASLHRAERVMGLGVEGFVGSPLNYVIPVELGTKPHFPPVDALIDWVKTRFGISSEKIARGVAFLVARKISRTGTTAALMFERGFAATEPQVRSIFERAQNRIAVRLAGSA